jgi:hypothetical protein
VLEGEIFAGVPRVAVERDRVLSCTLHHYDQRGLGPATSVRINGIPAALAGTSPLVYGEDEVGAEGSPILDNHITRTWQALVPKGETVTIQIEMPAVVPWIIGTLARVTGCDPTRTTFVAKRDPGFPASAVSFDLSVATRPGTALHVLAGGDLVGIPASGGWSGITTAGPASSPSGAGASRPRPSLPSRRRGRSRRALGRGGYVFRERHRRGLRPGVSGERGSSRFTSAPQPRYTSCDLFGLLYRSS